ncbi:MAG TPA: nuclear transport factor 2 family protein [Terriglobales bacterium]|nr:nuclear transport factor 2 family protein [Terriglobales bacterium]
MRRLEVPTPWFRKPNSSSEHLWNDAQIHRDSHALEALIADGFVNTEYDGEVSERDKFLADIKNPELKPSADEDSRRESERLPGIRP